MSGAPLGERDLTRLINRLKPRLAARRFAFDESDEDRLHPDSFALIREEEAITVIRESATGGWARITLEVHSSLEAVGLTAVVARCLADAGISANVIAALHHDHIFVPWERRDDAIAVLEALSTQGSSLA